MTTLSALRAIEKQLIKLSKITPAREIRDLLIALNSTANIGDKYPFGNKELTEKVKKFEAEGLISYDDKWRKWGKGKKASKAG